ncbi:Katanin p60 atpase-containing subunit, partial [Globisporangium splendens]
MTTAEHASAAVDVQRQLLRARELCLLGDYESGLPEFQHVLQGVKRQCAAASNSNSANVRQYEYAAMVEYQQMLHDLKFVASNMQATQRRTKLQDEARARKQRLGRLEGEKRAASLDKVGQQDAGGWNNSTAVDDDMNGRTQRWEKLRAADRPLVRHSMTTRHTSTNNVASTRERKLPPWANKRETQSTDVISTAVSRFSNRALQNRKLPTNTITRSSAAVKGKENGHRSSVKRTTTAASKAAEPASRRTSRGSDKSRRRESVLSSASSSPDSKSNTIAGKQKYSDLAKEYGWVDQELIEAIERDIVDQSERITFNDIAGLEHTKQLLQETVMLPQIAPHLFEAVAHECGATFFNVSASTLSSKYRGDSEKMVRILFDMARYYEPSIIFMDEIDAIASARGAATEHEASRRVKTELLVQINGVSSIEHEGARVMLLAATNLPWELDEAMRRRLTKRVYIPLPEADARRALFHLNLKRVELAPDVDVEELVQETQGYSGDDITSVCETAKRMPVKRVYTPGLLMELSRQDQEAGDDLRELLEKKRLIVTKDDFGEALHNVSKSIGQDQLLRFQAWETEFGSK